MKQRWAVVGGGMLGCTLALRLKQRGHDVTLYEAAPVLGGLASAWSLGPVQWDRHYHVTLMSDFRLRAVLEEIGAADELEWVETKTGFYTDGKLYSMSNSLEFLAFPPLGLFDKFRLGATIMLASRTEDWRTLERVPVGDWLTKWSGRRTFDKIWRPLLRAKLGDAWRETSAAFIWATIQRMYAAKKGGLKKEMFGYVRGGYARVLERIGETLASHGVEVRLGARVKRVGPAEGKNGGLMVDRKRFDRVAVTMAPPVAARVVDGLVPREKRSWESMKFQGIVCASVLLKKPLTRYYVTNITDEWVPFTGVIDMTALIDPREVGGRGLVYLPKYCAPDDPLMTASDAEIRTLFLGALRRMFPDRISDDDVEAFEVSRVKYVFPVPTLGYSTRVPPIKTSVEGLFALSSAHIVNGTLNVNETVTLAEDSLGVLDG